jgi:branched-chain amino acid transport system substrate-binding protein
MRVLGNAVHLLISALVAVGVLIGCAGDHGTTIRVACVGPMTGEQAKQGKDMLDGAQLAVDEWNARGGLLGKKIELLVGDDAQDPKQANAVANKMFTQGVVVIDGHYNSSCTIPASEVYNQRHMVCLTPASTNPMVTDRAYPTIFRVCGRDDQQGRAAAEYVAGHMPEARVAVLDDKTTYGAGLASEFLKNYVALTGKQPVYTGVIVKEDQDYTPVLTTVKAQAPDLVYFGGLYPQAGLVVKQMRQLGMSAVFMSGDGTYDPEFIRIAGAENAEGTFLTFIPDQEKIPAAQKVVAEYKKRFGEVGPYSLYSYEAFDIAFQGIRKAGTTDGLRVAQAIHSMTFDTVFGPMSFDAKGDVLKSPYVMWRVEKGRLVQLPPDK